MQNDLATNHAVEIAITSATATEVSGTVRVIRDQPSASSTTFDGDFTGVRLANAINIEADLTSRSPSTIHVIINATLDNTKTTPLTGTVSVSGDSGSGLNGAYGLAATKNPAQLGSPDDWTFYDGTFRFSSSNSGEANLEIWRQVGNFVVGWLEVKADQPEGDSWQTVWGHQVDESRIDVLKGTVQGNRLVMKAYSDDSWITLDVTVSGTKLSGELRVDSDEYNDHYKGPVTLNRNVPSPR